MLRLRQGLGFREWKKPSACARPQCHRGVGRKSPLLGTRGPRTCCSARTGLAGRGWRAAPTEFRGPWLRSPWDKRPRFPSVALRAVSTEAGAQRADARGGRGAAGACGVLGSQRLGRVMGRAWAGAGTFGEHAAGGSSRLPITFAQNKTLSCQSSCFRSQAPTPGARAPASPDKLRSAGASGASLPPNGAPEPRTPSA